MCTVMKYTFSTYGKTEIMKTCEISNSEKSGYYVIIYLYMIVMICYFV